MELEGIIVLLIKALLVIVLLYLIVQVALAVA